MLCQELGVFDGCQREVGGHVPGQVLVPLVQKLHGDGNGLVHHIFFGVVLEEEEDNKDIND